MNVYYVARTADVSRKAVTVPDDVDVQPISQSDLTALAVLYARAYELDLDAHDAAVEEMESAFDGTWGTLWPEASPVAWADGKPIAVVQTVHRPSMGDAPDCPWLIEVFTDPGHRRMGLGGSLIARACAVVAAARGDRIGLTVDVDNDSALTLYRSLGFVPAD